MYVCTCRRPHLARHRSDLSRTSFYAPTVARRVGLSPQFVVAFGTVVGPLLAQSHIWRQSAASKPDLTSAGSGQEHPHEALELGAGYRNPAPTGYSRYDRSHTFLIYIMRIGFRSTGGSVSFYTHADIKYQVRLTISESITLLR